MCSSTNATAPSKPTAHEQPPESVRRLAFVGVTDGEADGDALGALAPSDPTGLARSIASHSRVTEAVVLSTCNRVEVYVSARSPGDRETAIAVARGALGSADGADDVPDGRRVAVGREVAAHLCRVACGLDSEILGEDHVLGQVSRTFDAAEEAGLAGGVLSRVADAAVGVGREVRAETAINEGTVGYGSAACDAIAETEPDPTHLVVVGAGEMATAVVRAAEARWDVRIDVVNRSPAGDLPSEEGTRWSLDEIGTALVGADAVVTATAAQEPVLTTEHDSDLAAETPIVDLAAPPDVGDGVAADRPVTRLGELQSRVAAGADTRQAAVPAAERRVAAAVDRFVARERESRAEDAIRSLHREAAEIRARELARARRRLDADDADVDAVLDDFASALTSRLLAAPTEGLKSAARDGDDRTVATARELFDLGGEPE